MFSGIPLGFTGLREALPDLMGWRVLGPGYGKVQAARMALAALEAAHSFDVPCRVPKAIRGRCFRPLNRKRRKHRPGPLAWRRHRNHLAQASRRRNRGRS